MTDTRIRLERKNKIALVVMNRPEKKNAFDMAMFEALEQVTLELERDLPRAVVLTGADDRAFSAGFDVTLENPMTEEFLDAVNKKDTTLARKIIKQMRRAVDGFVNLPVPIIAAVNGPAYGGGMELASQISQNGPKAIRHALAVLRQSRDLSLKNALDKEAELAADLIASGECIHGITAFMEKKPAQFPD